MERKMTIARNHIIFLNVDTAKISDEKLMAVISNYIKYDILCICTIVCSVFFILFPLSVCLHLTSVMCICLLLIIESCMKTLYF
jgi:hypothetical protein